MKDTMLLMVGAAAGIGLYMGASNMAKDKKLKKKMSNLATSASDLLK